MHVFYSQEYFLKTENLHFFLNEQTNLSSNLKSGHEGSLLIIIDNLKNKWIRRSGLGEMVNDNFSKGS